MVKSLENYNIIPIEVSESWNYCNTVVSIKKGEHNKVK